MKPQGKLLIEGKARDYAAEYARYHGQPKQRAERSQRNKARRKLKLKVGDKREVDHKRPICKGGGNGKGNLRAVSFKTNRKKGNRNEMAEARLDISRHCPTCLPPGIKGRFEYDGTEKASDGKTVKLYRCSNCGLEARIKKRGPLKRGSPSQKKAIDRIRKLVDDESYDIEEMEERPDTNDVWLRVIPKKFYDNRALIRVGSGGSLMAHIDSFGSSKTIKASGRKAWLKLDTRFGIFEPSKQEDFDVLMSAMRRLSKAAGTDSPEKEAARKRVEADFKKAGYTDQATVIRELTKILSKRHKVTRDKRKRLVVT